MRFFAGPSSDMFVKVAAKVQLFFHICKKKHRFLMLFLVKCVFTLAPQLKCAHSYGAAAARRL